MVREDELRHLRCMHSGSILRPVDADQLERLNALIQSGSIRDRRGNRVEQTFCDGLVNDDGSVFYPVVKGVLQMMDDEYLLLTQLGDS